MNEGVDALTLDIIVPTDSQIRELYRQLSHRKHSISHKATPDYEAHALFVNNHPYRAWYIIKKGEDILGNVYVQNDNSIGLNCIDDITALQIKMLLTLLTTELSPLAGVPSVRFGAFFLNVASSNIALQEKLQTIGLKETQRSFCFTQAFGDIESDDRD